MRTVILACFLWWNEAALRGSLKWRVTYRIGVHTILESFSCQHEKYSVSYEHSLNRRDTTPNKTTIHTHTHTNEQLRLPQEKEWRPVWGDVTRDDSQRPFLVQHSAAMLQQCCNHSKQCQNNVATLCWAKNRRCESSRVTSPLRPEDGDCGEKVAYKKKLAFF